LWWLAVRVVGQGNMGVVVVLVAIAQEHYL
jgi:hypothetical protein